jgi:hypothetical protein
MVCHLELRYVSNRMLRNQIQMIALITFLNDEIAVQEYIYGAKIAYMHDNFKNNAPQKRLHNTYECHVSFPPLSKPDLMLSSMDRDAGHTSLDTDRISNSFVSVIFLSLTSPPFFGHVR